MPNQVNLISTFKNVFVDGPLKKFSVCNGYEFIIRTHGAGPIFEKSTLSEDENVKLEELVNELLDSGYLERTDSKWSSPVKPKEIDGNRWKAADLR